MLETLTFGRKLLLSLVCVTVFGNFALAHSKSPTAPGEPEEKDARLSAILAEMKKAGESLRSLSAKFEQTDHDYILSENEMSAGVAYIQVPGRIRWEHQEPQPKILLIKDDLVRLYNPTAHQVHEFEQSKDSSGRARGADLLVGFGKSNEKIGENYDVELLEETGDSVVLKLIPKPDSAAALFMAIDLTLDKTTWTPIRSVFHEANRDWTDIQFQDVVINGKLPGDIFELKLPPGVEVVRQD